MDGSSIYSTHRLPTWRSALFVPADNPRFIAKSCSIAADAVILDLEDSIAPSSKAVAREAVASAAKTIAATGRDVVVRINASLALSVRDIEAVIGPDVSALLVPKVLSGSHVRLLEQLMAECEVRAGLLRGRTALVPVVETPDAFQQMPAIATASSRIVALGLGAEDFALACGFECSEETMLLPKQTMVMAAATAGVLAMGYVGSVAWFEDIDAFRHMARRSRAFGFSFGTCIHPSQVAAANEAFGVDEAEIVRARAMLQAADHAAKQGAVAFRFEGKMVDEPILERARRVLARAQALR